MLVFVILLILPFHLKFIFIQFFIIFYTNGFCQSIIILLAWPQSI